MHLSRRQAHPSRPRRCTHRDLGIQITTEASRKLFYRYAARDTLCSTAAKDGSGGGGAVVDPDESGMGLCLHPAVPNL